MANVKMNRISNKDVKEIIKNHILENFSDLEYDGIDNMDNVGKLKHQIDFMLCGNMTPIEACRQYVGAGDILVSNYDMENFLESLGLQTKAYKDNVYDYYVEYVSKVMNEIYHDLT